MVKILQLPDGLKPKAEEIASELGLDEVILCARPTYGSCDLCLNEASLFNADVIHVGHVPFSNLKEKAEFKIFKSELDVDAVVDAIASIPYSKISLVCLAQYIHYLTKIKKKCNEKGIEIVLKENRLTGEKGLLLGCDVSAVDLSSEAVVLIADGTFHAKALVSVDIPVFIYSPSSNAITDITKNIKRWRKRRRGILTSALYAKKWGILISTKVGQFNPSFAKEVKKELNSIGKKAWFIVGDELSPLSFSNFTFIDAFVTTACPRLVDDSSAIGRPILDKALFDEYISLIKR